MKAQRVSTTRGRWLILIHQLPPSPSYLRVKISRRLHQIGAVPIKNTVYALPCTKQSKEDFTTLFREITKSGGEATICEARLVEGLTDKDLENLFNEARNGDYARLAEEILRAEASDLRRLKRRFNIVCGIDLFGAPGRSAAERALVEAGRSTSGKSASGTEAGPKTQQREDVRGRTWVTREDIHVDRMASAWLIRRFIDAKARFKFVPKHGYFPKPGELRFDMSNGEFTHEGDDCTFETLIRRLKLDDPALRPIADIVHDIDIKDGKFQREETAGLAHVIAGVAMSHSADLARLARSAQVFDDLYEYFRKK